MWVDGTRSPKWRRRKRGRGREMKKVLKGEVDDRKRDEKGKMDQIFELLNHLQSVQYKQFCALCLSRQ